ncbi:hypothetical protein PsYK624_131190 [Phanerochaete sordida]|uniref:Uncharacterized protein n=1 Tax=Phanerochaete sordida TaxID=48140 RepID=A0A9P3LIV0_9APHY|nr:hypothetical protein PsYK624_131190 [Phanerochaete sordida]
MAIFGTNGVVVHAQKHPRLIHLLGVLLFLNMLIILPSWKPVTSLHITSYLPNNLENDGGKWVCGIDAIVEQQHLSAVYSFGGNYNRSSGGAVLALAPHCEVWGFDFSVAVLGLEAHPAHFFSYKHNSAHLAPLEVTLLELMHQNQ